MDRDAILKLAREAGGYDEFTSPPTDWDAGDFVMSPAQLEQFAALLLAAATAAQPAIPEGMKLVPVEDPRVVDDLAALVGRLAHSLKNAAPNSELPAQALDYLKRHRLQGSPLREAAATAAQQVMPEIRYVAPINFGVRTRSVHKQGWDAAIEAMREVKAATAAQPDINVELLTSLKACLDKGSRWHPCDPVVAQARAVIARAEDAAPAAQPAVPDVTGAFEAPCPSCGMTLEWRPMADLKDDPFAELREAPQDPGEPRPGKTDLG